MVNELFLSADVAESRTVTLTRAEPTAIVFHVGDNWGLRLDKDGIRANPDIPIDETATAVMEALKTHWIDLTKQVDAARREERATCAARLHDLEEQLVRLRAAL